MPTKERYSQYLTVQEKWKWPLLCAMFLLTTLVVNHRVVMRMQHSTFNFEDNIGWAYLINEIGKSLVEGIQHAGNPFIDLATKGIQIVSPLQEGVAGVLSVTTPLGPVFFVNFVILLNYFLAAFFAAKLIEYLTKDFQLAFLAGIFYGFSSMSIYVTWFNLAGFCFAPAVLLYLLRYLSDHRQRDIYFCSLFTFLLSASSTYYVPFPYVLLMPLFFLRIKDCKWCTLGRLSVAILVGTFMAGLLYIIPIYLSSSIGSVDASIIGGTLTDRGQDIASLLQPNSFNQVTHYFYSQFLPTAPYFRYSQYFGFTSLILVVSGIIYTARRRALLQMYALILFCISIVLFAGEYLVFFGYDTGIPLPFHVIHQFHYGNILRKSAYFFHLIALGALILSVYVLNNIPKDRKKSLFIFVIACMILMENIVAFDRPVLSIPDRHALYAHVEGKFLGLPNTNFSMNSFLLDASLYSKQMVFRYSDLFSIESQTKINAAHGETTPVGFIWRGNQFIYFGGNNCLLDNLIFGTTNSCNEANDAAAIRAMGIHYVVVYKHYVKDFFFTCDDTCDFYNKVRDILQSNTNIFHKEYEDDEGLVYSVAPF